jgi:hypothetical protein
MNSLLKKIKQWIVTYQADIILFIGVILISLLSFAMGYILAKQQEKEPIKIEQRDANILMHANDTNKIRIISIIRILVSIYEGSHYWSGNLRSLFGMETFRERI